MGVLGVDHVAFRSPDPDGLRDFYEELTGAEALDGEHAPLRLGSLVLAFFEGQAPGGEDELALEVDAIGFGEVLAAAERMGCLERGPVEHGPWSRGFYLRDPDGRRLEFLYADRAVHWRE